MLQKDPPLRKSTHGNRREPISCGTVPNLNSNSGEQWEPHCLFEKAKRDHPKVHQSVLRLLWGTGDFKGQIAVPVCIRHQDKFTTAAAVGPWCLLEWDGPDSHQYREQEREDKAQEREKRKETRQAQMLGTLQGSPLANAKSLIDKVQGKLLTCKQVGH